ncbi:MAG: PAS domain S-box protein [Chloroflexaceae bacterium]|nr:PAS domain S-box protein [Chloroflexaceae bacterium]
MTDESDDMKVVALQQENEELRQQVAKLELMWTVGTRDEGMYRTLVEHSIQALVIFQGEGIAFVNTAAAEITGYSVEELMGSSPDVINALTPPDQQALVWGNIHGHLQGIAPPLPFQYPLIRKDGEERWIELMSVRSQYRGQTALLATFIDITERKRAEEAYHSLVDYSLQGLVILQDQQVMFANSMMGVITGYEVGELLSLSLEGFFDLVHPEQRDMVRERVLACMTGSLVAPVYEFRLVRKPGKQVLWLEVNAVRISYHGKPAVQIACVDLTDHKNAEELLRESERKFRNVIEQSSEGINLTNEEGLYIEWNRAAEQISGLKREQVLGQPAWDVLYGLLPRNAKNMKMYEYYKGSIQAVLKTGQSPWINEMSERLFQFPGQDVADRYIEQRAFAIKTNKGFMLCSVFRDVTEKKQAERELRLSHDRLQQLNQQMTQIQEDERSRLSRELHDEASQSLTALLITLQLVHERLPASSSDLRHHLVDALGMTRSTMDRLRSLAYDLRLPALDTLGLNGAIEEMCEMFVRRTNIAVTPFVPPTLPPLSDDINICLYRFVQEALTNVARHSRASGVWVTLNYDPETVTVQVEDNGRGVDPEVLQRSGPQVGGMGLIGMRERLDCLGGTLDIHTGKGRGMSLVATIPWSKGL